MDQNVAVVSFAGTMVLLSGIGLIWIHIKFYKYGVDLGRVYDEEPVPEQTPTEQPVNPKPAENIVVAPTQTVTPTPAPPVAAPVTPTPVVSPQKPVTPTVVPVVANSEEAEEPSELMTVPISKIKHVAPPQPLKRK